MLKYVVIVLLIAAGLIYFTFMGKVKNSVHATETIETDRSKSIPNEKNLEKSNRNESKEVTQELSEEAEADAQEAEETQKDVDADEETDIDDEPAPKRKLVGGAEVEWIEGSDEPKDGNGFGKPPRF